MKAFKIFLTLVTVTTIVTGRELPLVDDDNESQLDDVFAGDNIEDSKLMNDMMKEEEELDLSNSDDQLLLSDASSESQDFVQPPRSSLPPSNSSPRPPSSNSSPRPPPSHGSPRPPSPSHPPRPNKKPLPSHLPQKPHNTPTHHLPLPPLLGKPGSRPPRPPTILLEVNL